MTNPNDPFDLFLRKLESHTPLNDDDRAAIRALPYKERVMEPGAYLVRDGEALDTCSILMSGFAFRQKLTADGGRQIVSMHIPGEALDLQHLLLDHADHNVQALTRARLAFVSRSRLQALTFERPTLGKAMLVCMLIEASIVREWVLNVGRRDSRAALAHLLCELAVRLEAQGLTGEYSYELPMTQEQIGDALGLTSVHVNRTLKGLAAEGLITRNNRRVNFPRWKALRDVAGFNSRYLHLDRQRSVEEGSVIHESE